MSGTVLSISSQVAYGPVGNSATAPALESLGFTVLQVPTIVLSYHPGHATPAGFRTPAEPFDAILDALLAQGMLADCRAVFTGYFATPEQARSAAGIVGMLKRADPSVAYFCDPVMGDDPHGLYVPLPVAEAIRDELVPLADFLAPNRFELEWLSGISVADREQAAQAARAIGAGETLATSIPSQDSILTFALAKDGVHEAAVRRRHGVPHGTGDFLSGLYFGHRLLGKPPGDALEAAMGRLMKVIDASAGSKALDLRKGLA